MHENIETTRTASEWMTPKEAAGHLRLSKSTVLRLAASGILPVTRINQRVLRFHQDHIHEVLLKRTKLGLGRPGRPKSDAAGCQ